MCHGSENTLLALRMMQSDDAEVQELATKMKQLMSVKDMLAGPDWNAATFGNGLLPRCVACRAGTRFLAMMPMSTLATLAKRADAKRSKRTELSRCRWPVLLMSWVASQ